VQRIQFAPFRFIKLMCFNLNFKSFQFKSVCFLLFIHSPLILNSSFASASGKLKPRELYRFIRVQETRYYDIHEIQSINVKFSLIACIFFASRPRCFIFSLPAFNRLMEGGNMGGSLKLFLCGT
jgi:hypothetical protein